MVKLKERIRHHVEKVMRVQSSPHYVALSFAIGALIAILPTPGFGILLGLLIVFIFKKLNKFSLFLAMLIFNPFILFPIYLLSYKLGNLLFSSLPVVSYEVPILDKLFDFTRRFLIGNLILALLISGLSYFAVRGVIWLYRKIKSRNT